MAKWNKVLVSGSNIEVNNITSSGDFDLNGTADIGGNLNATSGNTTLGTTDTEDLTVNRNLGVVGDTILGDSSEKKIITTGRFESNIIPTTDSTFNLGTETLKWNIFAENIFANTIQAGEISGSFNLSNLTDGNGISNFTYDGNSTATITADVDDSTIGNTEGGGSQLGVKDSGITETHLSSSVAGEGLSGGNGTPLSVDYGSSSGTAAEGSKTVNVSGTGNEIEVSGNAQALGNNPSFTVGLPNNVTISNNLTVSNDATIQGDLFVNGTTTQVNTANLLVEDKFILLNSGSANPDEGGIVIDEGGQSGHAYVYDSNGERFGYTSSLDSTATDATPDAFAAAVVDEAAGHSDVAEYQKNGNIRVTSDGEIFIYS